MVLGRQMEAGFAKHGVVPVYDAPAGALPDGLPAPNTRGERALGITGVSGDAWVQTVVNSLNRQYNLGVTPPVPHALERALGDHEVWDEPGRIMVGMASRASLTNATQYSAKIILRTGMRPPAGGASPDEG